MFYEVKCSMVFTVDWCMSSTNRVNKTCRIYIEENFTFHLEVFLIIFTDIFCYSKLQVDALPTWNTITLTSPAPPHCSDLLLKPTNATIPAISKPTREWSLSQAQLSIKVRRKWATKTIRLVLETLQLQKAKRRLSRRADNKAHLSSFFSFLSPYLKLF